MDHFCYLRLTSFIPSSLAVTCWERADLLALWYVMFSCVFVTIPNGVLDQVWYLIVLIPDLCFLSYFVCIIGCSRLRKENHLLAHMNGCRHDAIMRQLCRLGKPSGTTGTEQNGGAGPGVYHRTLRRLLTGSHEGLVGRVLSFLLSIEKVDCLREVKKHCLCQIIYKLIYGNFFQI